MRTRLIAVLSVWLLSLGCGGSGGTAPGPDASVDAGGAGGGDAGPGDGGSGDAGAAGYASLAEFCAQDDVLQCARWVKCGLMATQAGCEDTLANKWRPSACRPLQLAAVNDGRMVFDGVAAKACHQAYLSHACSGPENFAFPECVGAFKGVVPLGGACFRDEECGSTAYCSSSANVCPSTCAPRKPAGAAATRTGECAEGAVVYAGACQAPIALGASCAPAGGATDPQPCVEWAYCGAGSVCVQRAEAGAPCPTGPECSPWLWCDNGTCTPYETAGMTCSQNVCRWDLFCDFIGYGGDGTCKERLPEGGSCWGGGNCSGKSTCSIPSGAQRGSCVPEGDLGASCMHWDDCQEGLSCQQGTCQPARKLGQSCSTNECDHYLTCSQGTCVRTICFDETP